MQEEGEHERNILPVYESIPPPWLPKTHGSADLGYSGFYPPRPGQPEDVMSEANVRNGFIIGECVPAETFSAQEMVQARFSQPDALVDLEELMNEIFTRRADRVPTIPAPNFRMPSRVTLNDSKRQAWFADLANPDVPLHKLGKNVPHGAKGQDLLDLLHSYNVAIPRAVWFLRVFGANETAGLRNRPNYVPTQYSIDWANVVTGYIKKQLTDIALPSAPRAGMNIKQTFKGVLSDSESREKWISRFSYCLRLLRTFYSQGLVDNLVLLAWIVQTMATCNLAQAAFVGRLAEEYLGGMLSSRALMKPFVDACLNKLVELSTTAAIDYLPNLDALLRVLIRRACAALPDALVSPQTWNVHFDLLGEILTPKEPNDQQRDTAFESLRVSELDRLLLDSYLDVKQRNEAMLFKTLPPRVLAHLGSAVKDIQLLNSISRITDINDCSFFDSISDTSPPAIFYSKVSTLLTWSVTSLQYGDHRPYVVFSLLRQWRDRYSERATRRDLSSPSPEQFLQDQLFDWLDESEGAADEGNLSRVAAVFGKLVKEGLFGYAEYVQRLVARGEQGLTYPQEPESRHRKLLRCIPLQFSSPDLVGQRKVILYGARARETPDDVNARAIRKEIRAVIPQLFGAETPSDTLQSVKDLLDDCPILAAASRFEQVGMFRQWLMPLVRKAIDRQALSNANLLHMYSVVVELMTYAKCYSSVLELTLAVLSHPLNADLMMVVIDTLRRHLIIWECMRSTGTICTALYNVHQVARTRGIMSRALLSLLIEIDNGRHLDVQSRDHVRLDIAAHAHALRPDPQAPCPVPDVLPEILLLAQDNNPDAPSILANSLWYKYRNSSDWGWKVWDNTVASLRQVPAMRLEVPARLACALCYGRFLLNVDQHIPGGIDDQVLQWFLGTGQREVAALNADAWDVLVCALLFLAVNDALSATTIFRGLINPAWQKAAGANSEEQCASIAVYLSAANTLFDKLVLCQHGGTDAISPTDFIEVQRLRTRRCNMYQELHFPLLIASIPTMVMIEMNKLIPEDARHACGILRKFACAADEFRREAHRHLDDVRNAFEKPLLEDGASGELSDVMVDALRHILSDEPSEFPDVVEGNWHCESSLLSPWRLEATAVQLQLTLRQMGRQLASESTAHIASDRLDQLTSVLFHHEMTSEEAYFVAEMASGVDVAVAGKFINNGFQCICEMLRKVTNLNQPAVLDDCVRRAGQLLRVLVHVAGSRQQSEVSVRQLKASVQDDFIEAIYVILHNIEITESSEGIMGTSDSLVFLLRLLQFDLGCSNIWTLKTKEISGKLVPTLYNLATVFGSADHIDLATYPLILDTLYYLIDEIPVDSRSVTFDAFRNYPSASPTSLPLSMPSKHRDQLRSLLLLTPENSTVLHLVTAHRDASGRLVHGESVLNRPWEWIENLGEPQSAGGDGDAKESIKNSASISLDLFNAYLVGDAVVHSGTEDPRIEANLRSFEDGLSSESIFKRDWRESRIDLDADDGVSSASSFVGRGATKAEEADEVMPLPVFSNTGSRRGSPAHSHKSSRGGSVGPTSTRASPLHSQTAASATKSEGSGAGSAAEPIVIDAPGEVDANGSTSMTSGLRSKRKLSVDDDDEIEIIENPRPSAGPGARAGKKPKGKTLPAGKTTAKTTSKARKKR